MNFKKHLEIAWNLTLQFIVPLILMTLIMVLVSSITLGILAPVVLAGYVHSILLMVREKREPTIQDLFSYMNLFLPIHFLLWNSTACAICQLQTAGVSPKAQELSCALGRLGSRRTRKILRSEGVCRNNLIFCQRTDRYIQQTAFSVNIFHKKNGICQQISGSVSIFLLSYRKV